MAFLLTEHDVENGGNGIFPPTAGAANVVEPDGVWRIVNTTSSFPLSLSVDGTVGNYNQGDVIGTDDNPDVTSFTLGTHIFQYEVQCESRLIFGFLELEVIEQLSAGQFATLEICDVCNDGCFERCRNVVIPNFLTGNPTQVSKVAAFNLQTNPNEFINNATAGTWFNFPYDVYHLFPASELARLQNDLNAYFAAAGQGSATISIVNGLVNINWENVCADWIYTYLNETATEFAISTPYVCP